MDPLRQRVKALKQTAVPAKDKAANVNYADTTQRA
jgi:hypothetical protein